MPSTPADLDEPMWLRQRVDQLQGLRRLVIDERTLTAIDRLIEEARERLDRIERRQHH